MTGPTRATQMLFHTFDVTRQVFYRSKLSYAIVNLKPLLPGHVLVVPRRNVPRLADLHDDELADLMQSVKRVGQVVEKVYKAAALNVACQDGVAAGQSVPHVHMHIIPRNTTDFGGNNDEVYPRLEDNERKLAGHLERKSPDSDSGMRIPKDEDRKPRSEEDMEREAQWLAGFFAAGPDHA